MAPGRQKPRTCVGCREEAPKRALIRLVRAPDGSVVLDVRGKLPGRGAYLCLCTECLKKARKTGALARALRTEITPSVYEELLAHIQAFASEKTPEKAAQEVCNLLGLARRAGMVRIGMDGVQSQCAVGSMLVLTAKDCSASVMRFVRNVLEREEKAPQHQHLSLPFSIERLSMALGTGRVQLVGLPLKGGLAQKIKLLLDEGGDAFEKQDTRL
ncbi:MAG: DUF448 domain-containing protein [Fretibacterium sp.]|mgnify:CR=1 FL=1|nr:DUF448 domain-containing protein [Fretibacterium sp.]